MSQRYREFENWSQESLERLSRGMSDCNCKRDIDKELEIRREIGPYLCKNCGHPEIQHSELMKEAV